VDTRRRDMLREIDATQRRLDRIVACIADGHGDPAVFGPQSTALHRRIEAMRAELAVMGERPTVVALRPHALDRYRQCIDELTETLGDGDAATGKAATAIRGLIETVTVHHRGRGKMLIQVRGRLAALVGDIEVGGTADKLNLICHSPHLQTATFTIEAAA